MQPVPLVILSVVLASSAAVGVTYFMQPPAPPAAQPATDGGETADRLAELERSIQRLQASLEAAGSADRTRVDPVSDERIAAAVGRWMQQNGAKAAVAAAADKPATGARLTFQQLLDKGVGSSDATAMWIQARKDGTIDDLVKMFEEHAANLPNDAAAQVAVGMAYIQKLQGMPPSIETGLLARKGDQAFDRALDIDPENWSARYTKSMSLSFWPAAFGKQREAIDNLVTLRKQQEGKPTEPRHAQTYVLLGNLYSQQGKSKEAREAWQAGLGLFPDNATLKKQLGQDEPANPRRNGR